MADAVGPSVSYNNFIVLLGGFMQAVRPPMNLPAILDNLQESHAELSALNRQLKEFELWQTQQAQHFKRSTEQIASMEKQVGGEVTLSK
jgi:hypothetical protein